MSLELLDTGEVQAASYDGAFIAGVPEAVFLIDIAGLKFFPAVGVSRGVASEWCLRIGD